MNKSRKVLRIKSGEFLMKIHSNRVETCYHIKDAMDLSGLNFEQLGNLLNNLYSVGYKDMKVLVTK